MPEEPRRFSVRYIFNAHRGSHFEDGVTLEEVVEWCIQYQSEDVNGVYIKVNDGRAAVAVPSEIVPKAFLEMLEYAIRTEERLQKGE